MSGVEPALHRAILCVDVEGFGDRRRTNPDQVVVRDGLYRSLRDAFTRSEVEWDACYHEDRGDGVLVLVSPDVPKNLLVGRVPRELSRRPRTAAGHAGSANDPATCCREVLRGWHGWLGHPARTGRAASGHHDRRPFASSYGRLTDVACGDPARLGCRPAGAGFGWLNAEGGAGPRHVTRGHPVSHQRCVAPDAPR